MMTVKQVTQDGDSLCEAMEVTYLSAGRDISVAEQLMYLRPSDKSWQTITDGMIYVMNEHGKTVSSYDLVSKKMTDTKLGSAD